MGSSDTIPAPLSLAPDLSEETMIDWIALFSAFGLGSLTVHFIQEWADRRRLQAERAAYDPRENNRDRSSR